jgi:multisubunit Na+/H+ antiporter MnhC subunit
MRPAASVPAPAIPARETFSVGSALSRSISVWGRNLPFFFAVSLLVYLPLLVLAPGIPTSGNGWLLWLAGIGISVVLSYVAIGFMTYSVLEQLRGRSPSPAASISYGASRAGPLLLAAIFTGILIGAAMLLLIIPGIILAVRWALVAPVVIAEKGVDPRARSAELTAGHRWALFGLLVLIGLVGLVLGAVCAVIFGQPTSLVPQLLGQTIPQALVLSYTAVVYGVIYYQLRSEKEGIDIEQLTSVFR